MRSYLLATAAVAVAIAATPAQATPYAFATTTYNNFQVILGGGATGVGGSVSVNAQQNYPGSVATGGTATGTFVGADNSSTGVLTAPYAHGGPDAPAVGPAPVSSPTPPPVGESSLKGGNGARAASSVGNFNVFGPTGDGGYSVVESGGVLPSGTVTSNASQRESVYTFGGGATGGTVTFSFLAQVFAEVMATQLGDSASASTNNTISEFVCGSSPSNCSSSPIATFAPPELQIALAIGPFTGDVTSGSMAFLPLFTTTFTLAANTFYQFNLASVLTETTSTPGAAIPEPVSIMLLGTGLLGLGLTRRRRAN